MSHPDPLYDDYNDFYGESMDYSDYNDEVFEMDGEECGHEDGYDDSMDGDHDSAMTSCGWGTDEDYGYYGDDTPMFDDYYGGE